MWSMELQMEFAMQAETNYNHIIYIGKANIEYSHTCSRNSVTRTLVIKANCSSIKKDLCVFNDFKGDQSCIPDVYRSR